MSSQNLVSLSLTDAQLSVIDQSLTDLETQLSGLIAMNAAQRKSLARMGDKSESFCRQTLNVLAQNPQVVPPSVALQDGLADLEALDRLRPRLQRMLRLTERAADTETALGSDVMNVALQGYALLKVAGRNQGLEGLRKELGSRFAKSPRQVDTPPTE
jgi:ABC-type transporter Mla subunit MlaD